MSRQERGAARHQKRPPRATSFTSRRQSSKIVVVLLILERLQKVFALHRVSLLYVGGAGMMYGVCDGFMTLRCVTDLFLMRVAEIE